jgi:hypothetical protein
VAIYLRLAGTEQVEVGAMQDEQLRHRSRELGKQAGSVPQAGDAVQFAEVQPLCETLNTCLSWRSNSKSPIL